MAEPNDDDFGKELAEAFAADEGVVEQPVTQPVADATNPNPATPPASDDKVEEPKKDDKPTDGAENKPGEEAPKTPETPAPGTPPADPSKPAEDPTKTPENPETPPAQDEPKPLTLDDVKSLINDVRTEERVSGQALQNATNEVMEAYYPDGLSNVLVDQATGKELRTPQDVIEASGGEMSAEEATRWLMNEQYKLDQNIAGIRKQAEQIAETTVNFKRDSTTVLQKYAPLFTAYPTLQQKAYDLMMKQVKIDPEKGVVLQAPDVMDLYDTYLEPYQKAYEYSTNKSATNPTTPPATPPAPATPGQDDRLDDTGDGGQSPVDDPNDFAQQVTKELAKGL